MSEKCAATLQEMANDYTAFATIDIDADLKGVHETVEEMQLHLEEFISILGMLQAKGDKVITANMSRFLSLRPQVNQLCKRIDALDYFIRRVNIDLTILETNMEIIESTFNSSDKRYPMLNPFSVFLRSYFRKSQHLIYRH
ncbi:PREDICTED: uncharacterized protein LOC105364683 isoform X2 [Ceratosolen solmsi marchali]|uniref:Uncharacterized protein LOC105364683 isoform X2 n=1 Tax=Ceratosolen solmsi marchali TaxID=326594 RepID=A0AAJ6YMU5_9HYME|nr:PREDICTED: uncharacterized protein LOC105364683 isoform X2 [Ceratosolen solmsi marchali]